MIASRKGKMIVYRCDLCKQEIPPLKNCLIRIGTTNECLIWDICPVCIPIMQQQLGEGRVFKLTGR